MLIRNTRPDGRELNLGFYKNGLSMQHLEQANVDQSIVESPSFQNLQNLGWVTIDQFDVDETRYAIKDEVTGGGTIPGGPGEDFTAEFEHDSSDPFVLRNYSTGDVVYGVSVKVVEAFDPGYQISVGTPANPELYLNRNDSLLTMLDTTFSCNTYMKFETNVSLQVYSYGTSANGKILIVVKE